MAATVEKKTFRKENRRTDRQKHKTRQKVVPTRNKEVIFGKILLAMRKNNNGILKSHFFVIKRSWK